MRSLAIAFLFFAIVCHAQSVSKPTQTGAGGSSSTATASVSGTVADGTGAVVAGATVNLRDAVGAVATTTTDAEGRYQFEHLNSGTYEVSVIAPGFAAYSNRRVEVGSGKAASLAVQLAPEGGRTNVEVTAENNDQIELEKSELAGAISQKELVTMGLNGRNFSQVVALTPGVSNQTQQDEAKVGVVGSAKYSVNGGRVEYNSFDVDGSDVLNTGIAASRGHVTLSVYPSLDALAEVKVLTSNYGAQYGRSASGTVLVTTRSGGAAFHGNAYEFLRNEIFNARDFKDPSGPAPLYRRQDFGFTGGGPLYVPHVYNASKDKTFYFFSEEFRFERSPSSFSQAVPSLNEREGDFSDVCSGSSTPDCPRGTLISDPARIVMDPNALAILNTNLIPVATASTGCTYSLTSAVTSDPATWPCYNITVSPDTYWREELFRVDHALNSTLKAYVRYIHDSWDTTTTAPQWQYNGVTSSFPTVLNRFVGPGLDVIGHITAVRTPSLVNDYSVGFLTQHISLKDLAGPGATLSLPAHLSSACGSLVSSCGIGSIFPNTTGKIPAINIAGSNGAYGGTGFMYDTSYAPWRNANPTVVVRDDLSINMGKHYVQAGVMLVDVQQSEVSSATGANTGDVQGLVSYTNVHAYNVNYTQTTGNAFADFLVENWENQSNTGTLTTDNAKGFANTYQQDSAQRFYSNRYTILEPYVQDDWHVRPRLTINLGLRMSLFGNWTPNGTSIYNFAADRFDATVAGSLKIDPTYGYVSDAATGDAILASATAPDSRTLNGLVQCGTNGVPASCMNSHRFNPAPRIGFAWDPTGKGGTSIRAGYGVFFEHGTGDEANSGSLTGTAPLVQSMTESAPPERQFSLECIDGRAPGCAKTVPAGAAFPLDVTAIPSKVVWPYVQQWSLSVQQQVGKDTVATLAYVGSKGTHLTTVRQLNQRAPVAVQNNHFGAHEPVHADLSLADGTTDRGVCSQDPQGPPAFETSTGYHYFEDNPVYTNLAIACSFQLVANAYRTYPGYGRILSVENLTNSSYNAAQVTVHRVRDPLDLGISYTFGHSIDASSDRFESSLGNSLDPKSNRASSGFDERNIFNLTYALKLNLDKLARVISDHGACADGDQACRDAHPWGSAQPPRVLMKILAGWELTGLTIHQSGTPFSIINGGSSTISALDNAGIANGLGAGSYPDVVAYPYHCATQSSNSVNSVVLGPVLGNRCMFVAPRGLTFGNTGRNFERNPSRTNHDIALHRYFSAWEGGRLEVRAEAFNVLNHPQYRIFDPEKGNTASNTISCYGDEDASYSAGARACDPGNAFLRPVDAHRPRTLQFGIKFEY